MDNLDEIYLHLLRDSQVGRSGSMALSVYVGRAGTGKTHACFEYIKQVIENNPGEPILYRTGAGHLYDWTQFGGVYAERRFYHGSCRRF